MKNAYPNNTCEDLIPTNHKLMYTHKTPVEKTFVIQIGCHHFRSLSFGERLKESMMLLLQNLLTKPSRESSPTI